MKHLDDEPKKSLKQTKPIKQIKDNITASEIMKEYLYGEQNEKSR